jgi:mycothiol synthase
VRSWFAHEELDVVVAEDGDELIGYGDRLREGTSSRVFLDVQVRRGDAGTGEALMQELEARAARDAPADAYAMTWVAEGDETMRDVVTTGGFELVRHSFQMARPLDDVDPPEWPGEIEVRPYDPRHEALVHATQQEAFADHWEHEDASLEEWRRWFVEGPSFDPSFWFVAWDGEEVAGISLCRIDASEDPKHGHVRVLAVRRPWRRRGLGTALLLHSFLDMKRRGMTKASLGVDAENTTGAVRLYEGAGMTVERRYDVYRKELT